MARVLTAAFASLAVTFATLVVPAPSAAARQRVNVSYHMTVAPMGRLNVCLNKTRTLFVAVKKTTRRSGAKKATSSNSVARETVEGRVADPTVATLSPTINHTRARSGSTTALFSAFFQVTGTKVGVTSIRFSHDYLTPLAPAGTTPPHAAPDITVRVRVVSCEFRFIALSRWNASSGFKPKMRSSLLTFVAARDFSGERFTKRTTVVNTATGSFASCTVKFTVSNSDAFVRGTLTDDALKFSIEYQPVTGTATVRCPPSAAMSNPYASQVDRLDNLSIPISGGTIRRTHVVKIPEVVRGKTTVYVNPL